MESDDRVSLAGSPPTDSSSSSPGPSSFKFDSSLMLKPPTALSKHLKFLRGFEVPDLMPIIDSAKKSLSELLDSISTQLPDLLRSIEHTISVQLQLLPQEIRYAIGQMDEWRKEHPYIVAGAILAVVTVSSASLIVDGVLLLFRVVGFGELGPVAGSWAALLQSTFYGPSTRGIFSIIQSITMTAKVVLPAAVFTELAAITSGILLFPRQVIREIVDKWFTDTRSLTGASGLALADLDALLHVGTGSEESIELLRGWMVGLRATCEAEGVPQVQWLDVVFQFLYKVVEEGVGQLRDN